MTVTAKLYSKVFGAAFHKEIDLLADDIRVTLHDSGYTPDQDVHDYYNDLTNELATANGYTAGGASIANDTFSYNASTNTYTYDGDDVSWTSSTLTARTAVVRDATPGTAATEPLILYQQSSADVSTTSGTFTVQWNASGIFTIVVG